MVKCERCGTRFGSIQAAVLEFCPRCKARDNVNVPLIVARTPEKGVTGWAPISADATDKGTHTEITPLGVSSAI